MSIVNVKKQKNYHSFEWVVNADVRLCFRYAQGILCPIMAENKHYKNKFNPKRWTNAFKVSDNLMREIADHCGERFGSVPVWRQGNKWVGRTVEALWSYPRRAVTR